MRVLILADLHHDFWNESAKDRDRLDAGRAALGTVDAVILAGDVSNKARVRWKAAANWLAPLAPTAGTFIFPGNHDYYGHRIDGDDKLQEVAAALGWSWVQQQTITLDGVRFLCATLWTDLALGRSPRENGPMLAARMNDYRCIRVASGGYRKLRPEDTGHIHARHLAWISEQLDSPFDGPTAVVSHHAPLAEALGQRDGVHDAAYGSDLSRFMGLHRGAGHRFWFHGHTHRAHPVDLPGWHVRSCSLGYPFEGREPDAILPGCVVDTQTLKDAWSCSN